MKFPQAQKPRIPPLFGLALGILAASTAAIFIRFAQEEAPSLVIAAYRLTFASLILLPSAYISRKNEIKSLKGKDLFLILLSGLFLALHFAFWITSLEFTSVASSVVLVTTIPLWVALFSPIFLKEKLSRLALFGMCIAFLGGIIIGLSDTCYWLGNQLMCPSLNEFFHGKAFIGDILALSGAIMAALYLMIGRRVRGQMSLLGYIFVVYGGASIVLVIMALIKREAFFGYPPQTYLLFLLLAIFPQLIGHSSLNWALRYLSAGYVSIALLGEPIGSTLLAYFLLDEIPGSIKLFGAFLILTGIITASRGEINK